MREDKDVLCFWLCAFSFSFAFFHVMPVLLKSFFKWPLTWGDTLDFLTPFAIIPLAYVFYSRANKILHSPYGQNPSPGTSMVFTRVFLAIGFLCYVDGHGIHLSSNSIARLLQNMKGSELYKATYLFDEVISHFIWHGGVFLISVGLIILASKLSFKSLSRKNIVFLAIGAALFGLTFTAEGIEGQSVIFVFPAAGVGFLLALFLYLKRQREKGLYPFLQFFMGANFFSLILFAYWGISRSGFPQFSELGWG